MSRNILVSKLTCSEVLAAYEFMLCPSMKYTLCATTLIKQECEKIDQSYLPVLLSWMGINRNTKRAILFGPPSLGSQGFTCTYTDQGISQLSMFIGHLRLKQEIGKLIWVLVEHLQLVIGVGEPVFAYNFSKVESYVESNWLTSLWTFSNSIRATIHMEDKWVIQLQRKEDMFLMTALSDRKWALTPKMMKRINACRLFLQVITLADICDGSGSYVTGNILKGQKHADRRSRYEWASQAYPSSLAWRLWNTMLRKCFCRNETGTAHLRHPLRRWLSPSPKHQVWLNYVNPNNSTLVTIPYGSALFCTHEQAYTSKIFHRRFVTHFTRPKRLIPVTILHESPIIIQISGVPLSWQSTPLDTSITVLRIPDYNIQAYIHSMTPFHQNAVGHVTISSVNIPCLSADIRNGTIVIASDGSVKEDATPGWIVHGPNSRKHGNGHGMVPGGGAPISSLRPECGGFLASLIAIDAILSTTPAILSGGSPPPIKQVCVLIDSKALISRINRWNTKGIKEVLAPDFDLIQAAHTIADKHNLKIIPAHIKSHQDDGVPYEDLKRQARMNCDCDALAEATRQCEHCNKCADHHCRLPPGHCATVEIDRRYITSHLAIAIREASFRDEAINYIIKNAKWSSADIFNLVDWESRQNASKKIF